MPDHRTDTREVLWEALLQAESEFERARRDFLSIIDDVPSGLSHTDGILRIRQVGRARTIAMENYMRAFQRFTEFATHGTVPDDILPPE